MADGFVKNQSWADDGDLTQGKGPELSLAPPDALMDGQPSPEERAHFVVKRLEQFIRDGRTVAQGMSFRQWQAMARIEIANAIIAAENIRQEDDVVTKRFLFVAASALVTIGFWGTLLAFDRVSYLPVAIICGGAGFCLFAFAAEWRIRKGLKVRRSEKRATSIRKVEDLNRRIKRMQKQLEDEAKALENALEKTAAAHKKARRAHIEL